MPLSYIIEIEKRIRLPNRMVWMCRFQQFNRIGKPVLQISGIRLFVAGLETGRDDTLLLIGR